MGNSSSWYPYRIGLTIVMACASSWEPELRVDECQLDVNSAQNRPQKAVLANAVASSKLLQAAHQVSQDGALLCGRSCLGGGTGSGAVSKVVAHSGRCARWRGDRTGSVNMECPASGETRLLQELAPDVRASFFFLSNRIHSLEPLPWTSCALILLESLTFVHFRSVCCCINTSLADDILASWQWAMGKYLFWISLEDLFSLKFQLFQPAMNTEQPFYWNDSNSISKLTGNLCQT